MSLALVIRQTALILGLVLTVIITGQASPPDYSMSGQATPTAIASLAALPEQTGATPPPAMDSGSAESADAPSMAGGPRLDPIGENAGAVFPPKSQATVPMQYRSGGHVLGFTSAGVLIAGRDHLLKVSFINAGAVAPRAGEDSEPATSATTPAMDSGSAESANAPSLARGPRLDPIGENAGAVFPPASESKGAAALTEVHYRNLWPGIDLRYDGQEGIARSTYTLAPGAKVEDIRLAYNVATELTDQGA